MTRRVSADVLLVGSLPSPSTDRALRDGARLFGDRVFALPDGESGPRAAWVGYEREQLVRPHPDVETTVLLPYSRGDLVNQIHERGEVLSVEHTPDGNRVHARVNPDLAGELEVYSV